MTVKEKDLELGEVFYHSLFDLANDGIMLMRGPKFYHCNQRALDILRRPREQVIGHYPWDISPPVQLDGQSTKTKGRKFLELGYAGKRQIFEWVHSSEDGTPFTVEVSLSLIPDTDEPYLLRHLRDISVRLHTEEALRKSEARYRQVVEDQTDFIVRWLPDGTRTFINESYCRYFRKPRNELIGSSFFSEIDPAEHELIQTKILQLTPDNPVFVDEHRAISPDGQYRWHRWIDHAFFDDNGNITELQSVGRDVHDQKVLEEALRVSEEKYYKAFRSCPSAILLSRMEDGTIIEANRGFEKITGYLEEEIAGRRATEVGLWAEPDKRAALIKELKEKGEVHDFEVKVQIKSGEFRDCVTSAEIIKIDGDPHIVTLTQDITETKVAHAALEHQANHDHLTGLPNRNLLKSKIDEAISAQNADFSGIVLMLMDLNNFKEINDTLGHYTGDQLLKKIGPRLLPVIDSIGGELARLGGDEFAILLKGLLDESAVILAAGKILEALDTPFVLDGTNLNIRASLGIACYPDQGKDSDALLRCADVAMYNAKAHGSGYAFYDPEKDPHSTRRLALLSDLHTAIGEDQLVLHYQPKVETRNGGLIGFESLVRWQHPTHGMIPPGQFIPLVEHSESIHPLTNWVLDNAIAQGVIWHRQGWNITVSVNISTRNLIDENCSSHIEWLLDRHGLQPDHLELEITESAFISDPDRTLRNLENIHATGVQLAIDDFGTGYSSMDYLKRMPIQTLKIDMSFVRQMSQSKQDAVMVKSAITLAHNLGIKIVAEGVEDVETLEMLSDMGCDYAQGYLISKPVPLEQIDGWIQQAQHRPWLNKTSPIGK